jgi:hypothetical protein
MQLLGGARDVAFMGHGDEVAEVAQFHMDTINIWECNLSYI